MPTDLERLVGLGVVIVVSVAAVVVLLRLSRRPAGEEAGLVLGYPPARYPVHHAAGSPPLQALAATQARLVAVYRQLPAHGGAATGELAIWLRVFLLQLREVMDTAYRVAVVTSVYGPSDHLARLVTEVQRLEVQIVDDMTQRLLGRAGDLPRDALDRRLATLRECAAELAGLAAPNVMHDA